MQPCQYFSKNTVLETERLVLRKLSISDASDMYEYARRPETSTYLLWNPHASESSTADLLRFIQKEYSAGRFFDFAVVLKSNGKMIGTAGFTALDEKNLCAEIGYVLNPDYWHMGLAAEAANILINFAFCELGFHRVEAKFMEMNINSRRVMEKCGMHFEGIARGRMLVKGIFRNIGCCALLSDEYFATERPNIYALQNKGSIFHRLLHGKEKN